MPVGLEEEAFWAISSRTLKAMSAENAVKAELLHTDIRALARRA